MAHTERITTLLENLGSNRDALLESLTARAKIAQSYARRYEDVRRSREKRAHEQRTNQHTAFALYVKIESRTFYFTHHVVAVVRRGDKTKKLSSHPTERAARNAQSAVDATGRYQGTAIRKHRKNATDPSKCTMIYNVREWGRLTH